MNSKLTTLIKAAALLGLPNKDIATAQDFLNHLEFALCLDTILTQLYEYEIPIDDRVYAYISDIAASMSLPEAEWSYIQELVKEQHTFPDAIRKELNNLLS